LTLVQHEKKSTYFSQYCHSDLRIFYEEVNFFALERVELGPESQCTNDLFSSKRQWQDSYIKGKIVEPNIHFYNPVVISRFFLYSRQENIHVRFHGWIDFG
jgi:hypothetical protein